MNFITWNINRSNNITTSVIQFLRQENLDVMLLQEVNKFSLSIIQKNFIDDYYIYTATEVLTTLFTSKKYFIVTLIKKHSNLKVIKHQKKQLTTVAANLYKLSRRSINVESLFIDIEVSKQYFSLVNCHLQCVCNPATRQNQFNSIINSCAHTPIIGGDFNTFLKPPLTFIFWFLFNLKANELLSDEHKYFQKLKKFSKPLSLQKTTIYKSGKLDFILFPQHQINLISEQVLSNCRFGSDHYPVLCKILFR